MRFSVYQVSRKGGREKNEDRMGYCYTRDAGLFALADGMGGEREQTRVPRIAVAHAVFVLFAAALAADLVDGKAHGRPGQAFAPVFRFSSCSLSRSLKLSLV